AKEKLEAARIAEGSGSPPGGLPPPGLQRKTLRPCRRVFSESWNPFFDPIPEGPSAPLSGFRGVNRALLLRFGTGEEILPPDPGTSLGGQMARFRIHIDALHALRNCEGTGRGAGKGFLHEGTPNHLGKAPL